MVLPQFLQRTYIIPTAIPGFRSSKDSRSISEQASTWVIDETSNLSSLVGHQVMAIRNCAYQVLDFPGIPPKHQFVSLQVGIALHAEHTPILM